MRGVVVVILCSMLSACWFNPAFAEEQNKTADSSTGQKVLAEFDNKKMTFEEFARKQPVLVSWFGVGAKVEQVESTLEQMILTDLLSKEAQVSGLADKPEVRAQVDNLLAKAYLAMRVPKSQIAVSDLEIEKYYRKNLDKYANNPQANVSQIVTATEADAEKARAALKSGSSFKEVAKQYSIEPYSAKHAGNLGTVPTFQLIPQLREKIQTLEVGEVSQPVKSSFGYHLVQLQQRPKVDHRPLEEVKKDIYDELFRGKERDMVKEIKEELWNKYNVSFSHQTIKDIVREGEAQNVNVEKASLGGRRREPGQATELQLISEALDLGKIPAQKTTETLLLSNSSSREIKIGRVGSTCNCIEVAIDNSTLQPGQVGKLSFTYDPDMFKEEGNLEKLIYIESDDQIEPRKFLRLRLEVVRK